MKKFLCIILMILLTFALFGCKKSGGNASDNSDTTQSLVEQLGEEQKEVVKKSDVTENGAIELSPGVFLLEVSAYSGIFFEDGSDKDCKNVMSAKIVNYTSEFYQVYNFTVFAGSEAYTFEASTLYPNAQMTVLEKSGKKVSGSLSKVSAKNDMVVQFASRPSVLLDKLKITYADGVINVENISKKKLSNVCVYFKNVDAEDTYLGGITYRASFGEIESGKIVQSPVSKVSSGSTKIVFATCQEVD